MPNNEPIRDPRVSREESPIDVVPQEPQPPVEEIMPAIQELQRELAKTSIISDAFKDYLMRATLMAVEEAMVSGGDNAVEQEVLRKEFLSRRFDDKSRVKLSAHNIEDLFKDCLRQPYGSRLIGLFFGTHFPEPNNAMEKLLTGSYDDVVAVREWLWRAINETPRDFCEVEKQCKQGQ